MDNGFLPPQVRGDVKRAPGTPANTSLDERIQQIRKWCAQGKPPREIFVLQQSKKFPWHYNRENMMRLIKLAREENIKALRKPQDEHIVDSIAKRTEIMELATKAGDFKLAIKIQETIDNLIGLRKDYGGHINNGSK